MVEVITAGTMNGTPEPIRTSWLSYRMAAQYFSQAAYTLELAKGAGEKVSPEEALEAAAVQLSCQLELHPECMCRVKAALREAERQWTTSR